MAGIKTTKTSDHLPVYQILPFLSWCFYILHGSVNLYKIQKNTGERCKTAQEPKDFVEGGEVGDRCLAFGGRLCNFHKEESN